MNKTTQIVLVLSFILTARQQLSGQTDSVEDVFPLGLHYSWTYQYQSILSCFGNTGEGSISGDSGQVTYEIVDSSINGDSIAWVVHSNWNLQVYYTDNFSGSFDTIYTSIDSGTFVLWERNRGNHQLFIDDYSYLANPIWKFVPLFADSQRVYRFATVDSVKRVSMSTFIDSYATWVPYRFSWVAESGLVKMNSDYFGSCGSHSRSNTQATLLRSILTSVKHPGLEKDLPSQFVLFQSYPDPFNPIATIRYNLQTASSISLKIFNLLGQDVATLSNRVEQPGEKSVQWNAAGFSSGVYLYKLEATSVSEPAKTLTRVRKMVLMK